MPEETALGPITDPPATCIEFFDGRITVTPPQMRRWKGDNPEMEPATVNWSAIGAQEPKVAGRFAEELMQAARVAYSLNKQHVEEPANV